MTTEFESFSVRISTTDEGKVQPEVIVVERVEKFDKDRIKDIVNEYDNLVDALAAIGYDVSNKQVVSEVEQMKDWTKIVVKSSDPVLLVKTLNDLRNPAH